MTGILLVDKPAGMTSHDVVDLIRKATGIRRIGHTGTLDPAATGLLILCIGKATRLSEYLIGMDKTYEGIMRLGIVTDSYDLDGEVLEERAVPEFSMAELQAACDGFTGSIEQMPPMVSAVKVGGERLYKLARRGETVERPTRSVTVHEFQVLGYDPPDVTVRVRCTRGTYVRSLCHDVGEQLGCGAVLAGLRRTWVGQHTVENARPVSAFQVRGDVEECLVSIDQALDLPVVSIRNSSRPQLANGAALIRTDLLDDCPVSEGWVQIKSESGQLLALGTMLASAAGLRVQPRRVLTQ
jgi:tRNA pseudouridine55 synthase